MKADGSLSVKQLKSELKSRGLGTVGNKTELVQRLQDANEYETSDLKPLSGQNVRMPL